MLLNSVQLFLNLAQFGFQIFQTFAQNCLKLGAAGMTGNGQDVSVPLMMQQHRMMTGASKKEVAFFVYVYHFKSL